MSSHHESRLRPTVSVRDSYAAPVAPVAHQDSPFEAVPAPLKPKAKKAKAKKR